MSDIRLLIADMDTNARSAIKTAALSEGYDFDETGDGIAALKLFRRNDYNLAIVSLELQMLDGINVCRQIRKTSDIPIIVVSSKCVVSDKLIMFGLGVDDYVCKPFSEHELFARVKVFLHRSSGINRPPAKINFSGLFIDAASRSVYVDETAVSLTPKEYELLFFLSSNPNKAYSRDMLLNEVWGYEFQGSDRTVDTHIKALREVIRPYESHIVTVWGFGYKFVV